MKNKKYKMVETFAGAGGSHIGFSKAGFESIFINEIDPNFSKTLLYNNRTVTKNNLETKNILDLNPLDILKKYKLNPGEIDLLFGGIVCKGFSLAGERSPNDERNYYFNKQIEIMSILKPKISIIENVPGITQAKILRSETDLELRKEIDYVWQELENYKGQKADLRKKNKITDEFIEKGHKLRKRKEDLLKFLKDKNYLIPVLTDIEKLFIKNGYSFTYKLLNSAWYGSGTKRERIIIVGVRKDLDAKFIYPKIKYNSESIRTKIDEEIKNKRYLKPKTVNDALALIKSKSDDLDNIPMNHSEKTTLRFSYIPEGKNIVKVMDDLPEELKISSFYSRGNTMRLDGNQPAPTLVPGHSNFPVHPSENRSITVREAATITGFPINYNFFGTHTKRCEQVGNAVPPKLAEAIGKSCVNLLNSINQV